MGPADGPAREARPPGARLPRERALAKRKSDFTTLYRGATGQYAWLFHRITGVAIILFLFAHVVDTAVIGWGPQAYARVMAVYENWVVRLLELGLVAAVIYHALNGVRVMVFDFWPATTKYTKGLTRATFLLWLACMVPITWLMGRQILDLLGVI